MKITSADLSISAVSKRQYPSEKLPEIALAGRSNVGKSAFINKMIQRRSLARTSSKPGKTQTLNFYKINEAFLIVDVPGYGYAKVSKQEREKWGHIMEEYFEGRENLVIVAIVMDSRHEPTNDDAQMYAYLKHLDIPVVIVATKLDKVPKSKTNQHVKRIKQSIQLDEEDHIVPFSGLTGEGKDQVWNIFKRYLFY